MPLDDNSDNVATGKKILDSNPEPLSDITVAVEIVTREKAYEMMKHNKANRTIRNSHVNALLREIAAHRFYPGIDSICFDIYGNLMNGQHRLRAIIESGIPVKLVIVRNMDPRAMKAFDANQTRKAKDYFAMHGKHYAATVESAARVLMSLKHVAETDKTLAHDKILPQQIIDFVDQQHTELFDEAPITGKAGRFLGLPSVILAWYHLASRVHPHVADKALHVLESGEQQYENDPLHRFVMRRLQGKREKENRLRDEYLYTLFHCYNLHSSKRELTRIKFSNEPVILKGVDYRKL
jgi:hypothetical protein